MIALRERLVRRGTEGESAVEKRLAAALREIQYAKEPNAHDHTIVNDDLDRAYDLLKKVALGERITGDTLPCL
jgi:guanylate kinase